MVFGIFVLVAGLASLFFMFNAGQLVHDKGKLVNAADAVAYSAGVMHARALNYTAYTNRALLANEMTVAQTVSMLSWIEYVERHAQTAVTFNCTTIYNLPAGETMLLYAPVCMAFAWASGYTSQINLRMGTGGAAMIAAVEVAKAGLQASQAYMHGSLVLSRRSVMQEAAAANFHNDGSVEVDDIPLEDGYTLFDGAPLLQMRTGNQRVRFADAATQSADRDGFMKSRRWRDESILPSCIGTNGIRHNRIDRAGGTSLIGLDEWKAIDSASLYTYRLNKNLRCVQRPERIVAGGGEAVFRLADAESNNKAAFGGSRAINPRASRSADSSANGSAYSGLPRFLSLSDRALAYAPHHSDPNRRNVNVRFSIRVTRRPSEIRNSEGRSLVRSSPAGVHGINHYQGAPKRGVYAAVSTSEVFFDRPVARSDGRTELANEFNPYWQVRLVRSPVAVVAATALQMN